MTMLKSDDKAFILDSKNWPRWPMLPMKKQGMTPTLPNIGVLLCTREFVAALIGKGKIKLYHVYMFKPPKNQKEWDAAPYTEYDTIDALLADGWIID